jgi:EAL domain-containing protein (putative c-di-GMP-specific phosphodiesterase class I)/methyl-accepting chemotaxis protein
MTLFRQIALLIFFAFLLLFTLVNINTFQNSGLFLRGQLQTSAQDTATVLGISISQTQSGNDIAALETLFNAVFDSGYYSDIRLVSTEGEIIHQKGRKLEVNGVPDWFISAVPLGQVIGKADVMQGWIPLGQLEITLHPGFAYANLYNNLKSNSLWFLTLFFLSLVLIWYILHIILKPLNKVVEQANAIDKNQFILQKASPKTRELRLVVDVMNKLVTKVQQVFTNQKQVLNQYHELLYVDELTQIPNRNHFLSELDSILSEGAVYQGRLAIIKMLRVNSTKKEKGYDATEKMLKCLAEIMTSRVSECSGHHIARISETEFALLLSSEFSIETIIKDIFEMFRDKVEAEKIKLALVSGFINVHSGQSQSGILAELDLALNQAEANGDYELYFIQEQDLVLPQGKMQWHHWFEKSLENKNFYLVAQPVFDKDMNIFQQEIYVRINDNTGKAIPASIFIPMAKSLGFSLEIDKTVFYLLQSFVADNTHEIPFALNLSVDFFEHPKALSELKIFLELYSRSSHKVSIEASHLALRQHPNSFAEVAKIIHDAEFEFGIDHIDLNYDLDILESVKPNYIKVSASLLDEMNKTNLSVAYQALRSLTQTLDTKLIAIGVDNDALYQRLLKLNIDAFQGNLLGEPKEIM